MFGPKPADITEFHAIFGGPSYMALVCPTSETTAYWSRRDGPGPDHADPPGAAGRLPRAQPAYHGPWDEVRESFTDPEKLNYTWFEHHLLDAPWNRGRVVLIGDAVHTCPPTIAQGAAMGFEDAVVLAELLTTRDRVDDELWSAFTARRFERVKTVVEASMQMAQWNLDHVQGDVPGVTRRVAAAVSTPA